MESIVLAKNAKPNETTPKVKLTFHSRPLILDCDIRSQFEIEFHMEYNNELKKRNNINIIFILDHLMKMANMPIYG